jgi:hypothetical protein
MEDRENREGRAKSDRSFKILIGMYAGVILVLAGGAVKTFPDLIGTAVHLVFLLVMIVVLVRETLAYREWLREEKAMDRLIGVINAREPRYPPPSDKVLDEEAYRDVQKR